MKSLIVVVCIIFCNMANAEKYTDDFWEKCPGPACPGTQSDGPAGITKEKHESDRLQNYFEREEELNRRERNLLEREMMIKEPMR